MKPYRVEGKKFNNNGELVDFHRTIDDPSRVHNMTIDRVIKRDTGEVIFDREKENAPVNIRSWWKNYIQQV